MLKFTHINKQEPEKEKALSRKNNFNEIYSKFDQKIAAQQASRCSQCGVPFCQIHCPLNNNIPDWLKFAAENRIEEAYEIASHTNNMPEICGRICPQDRLCEGNCVIEKSGHETVTIGSIEKYITDTAWENGLINPIYIKNEKNISVGIIGSGPAGLSAAEELRKKGYKIVIYDRYDRAGGLLMYGIPNFKLEKEIVSRRINRLIDSGIKFKLNCEIGSTISFDKIKEKHAAILIATGVYKSKEINLNKMNFSNVIPALEFLIASNKKGLKDKVTDFENGKLNSLGKNVLVIGGGDTAMDCVRTCIRQGAKTVSCLYRRNQSNMPGSQREVLNAIEEGVEFKWLSLPINYFGKNKIDKIEIVKMQLDSIDKTGRKNVEIIPNTNEIIECDFVIEALGFDPNDVKSIFNIPQLQINESGTIKINNQNMMTNYKGVFAAGDIVRGSSLVVWAIRDGRDVAEKIHNFLDKEDRIHA